MSLGALEEILIYEKQYLTKDQEDEIDNLQREHAIQFQRLNIARFCDCKPKQKISL